MNTSAQQQPGLLPDITTRFEGVVVSNAQVRIKPLDHEGHMVPVLVVDIEVGALHNVVHLEQPFPADAHQACEAAARRYRKGMRISADAPSVGLRMLALNVTHIHVHQPEDTPA